MRPFAGLLFGGTSPAPLREAVIGIIRAKACEPDAARAAAQPAANRIGRTRAPALPETLSIWALGNVFTPSFFSLVSAGSGRPASVNTLFVFLVLRTPATHRRRPNCCPTRCACRRDTNHRNCCFRRRDG